MTIWQQPDGPCGSKLQTKNSAQGGNFLRPMLAAPPGGGDMKKLMLSAFALLSATMLVPVTAHSQDYPKQDIHAIVGFPAGSGADVYGRVFAHKLAQDTTDS